MMTPRETLVAIGVVAGIDAAMLAVSGVLGFAACLATLPLLTQVYNQ
jgi:uncharacterized membrane protein YkgB